MLPASVRGLRVASLILLVGCAGAEAGGEDPLDTATAHLLPAGTVELGVGAYAAADAHRPLFPDDEGTLLVLPRLRLRTGLGGWGEIRVDGDARVAFDPAEGDAVRDAGDWWVSTKVRLGPADRRLVWAARFGAKIPSASDDDGLGTDLADVELAALASVRAGPVRIDGNLGLDVLGSPVRERAQEDLARYGLAAWWSPRRGPSLGVEVAGRSSGKFFPATSMFRAGIRLRRGAWRLEASAGTGLSDASPSLELRAGAAFSFERGAGAANGRRW